VGNFQLGDLTIRSLNTKIRHDIRHEIQIYSILGSQSSCYKKSVENKPTFLRNISSSSGPKTKPSAALLPTCLAYYSILEMDAMYSYETSLNFELTALSYILEDKTFQNMMG
jgi:hypothetical protein